jgi:hypothetical protein
MTIPPQDFQAALDALPTLLDGETVLELEAGTYPAVDVSRFVSTARGRLTIRGAGIGQTVVAGTLLHEARGQAWTAGVLVRGPVAVALADLTVDVVAGHGVWAHSLARLRLEDVAVTGSLDKGLAIWDGAALELAGAVSAGGFVSRGVQIGFGSRATFGATGSLTVTGSGSAWGIHVVDSSHFVVHGQSAAGIVVAVHNCQVAYQCGLNAIFTHQGPSGRVRAEHTGTGQDAIQCTDCSSWSTNQPLTVIHYGSSYANVNSQSYWEAVGGKSVIP